MDTSHVYNVNVTCSSERKGNMCSPELVAHGAPCVEVATPPPFNKGIEGMWSPEHLFTDAVSSCLMTTFLAIAENSKLEFTSFTCNSKGKMEQVNGKYSMTEVVLEPEVTITHESDKEKAERILQKSEAACLISNSITSKVILQTSIIVANIS